MYKFLITIDCKPGTRETVLERAPAVQAATRAEPGCIGYDFYRCTDNPDRMVFVETWTDKAAHDAHMEEAHTKEWIAFHQPYDETFSFELVTPVER